MTYIQKQLSEADKEELQKCIDSPVYFYNKYFKNENQKELTEKEYNEFIEERRNNPLKRRKIYAEYPMIPKDCYQILPEFLKTNIKD